MTKKQLYAIAILQDFVRDYGRLPLYHENKRTLGFPNGAFFRYHFGSFDAALIAAGVWLKDDTSQTESICMQCGDGFVKNKEGSKFCSKSCSTTFYNKKRCHTIETKDKIRKSLRERNALRRKVVGPFCKLYLGTCAHCGCAIASRRRRKYCNDHMVLYKSNQRNKYAFTFQFSKHPTLFPSFGILMKQYGMWSPTNTNGLTRDHRISVVEAIKQNYDPYYITHPINCELLCWQDNNHKNTKCSMSYEELIRLVDEYDRGQNDM